jgi:hypothetical protein
VSIGGGYICMQLNIPVSEKINVLAISVKCQCKKCGNIYGIYLNTIDGSIPSDFDNCRNCGQKSNYSNKREMVNYGNSNV